MTETGSQKIARLIRSRMAEDGGDDNPSRVTAAACDHLYRELSRWVGPDGCHALFTRALSEAKIDHPALERIHLRPGAEPYLEGASQANATSGESSTTVALEAMLVHLIDLLGRLIGEDMATKLVDRTIALPSEAIVTARNTKRKEG